MPSSGDSPCASAAAPPPIPLASAYAFTAEMKLCPVSRPTMTSKSQNARLAASSAISFRTSSRERKEDLLEPHRSRPRGQLVKRPLGDRASVVEQKKAIARPRRIAELMDGEHEGAAVFRHASQHIHHLPRLPEVEPIERFVEQKNRPWNRKTDG